MVGPDADEMNDSEPTMIQGNKRTEWEELLTPQQHNAM
jgi:hypothetical protein